MPLVHKTGQQQGRSVGNAWWHHCVETICMQMTLSVAFPVPCKTKLPKKIKVSVTNNLIHFVNTNTIYTHDWLLLLHVFCIGSLERLFQQNRCSPAAQLALLCAYLLHCTSLFLRVLLEAEIILTLQDRARQQWHVRHFHVYTTKTQNHSRQLVSRYTDWN